MTFFISKLLRYHIWLRMHGLTTYQHIQQKTLEAKAVESPKDKEITNEAAGAEQAIELTSKSLYQAQTQPPEEQIGKYNLYDEQNSVKPKAKEEGDSVKPNYVTSLKAFQGEGEVHFADDDDDDDDGFLSLPDTTTKKKTSPPTTPIHPKTFDLSDNSSSTFLTIQPTPKITRSSLIDLQGITNNQERDSEDVYASSDEFENHQHNESWHPTTHGYSQTPVRRKTQNSDSETSAYSIPKNFQM